MKVHVVAGDICGFSGDVIVNAANGVLLGGGGVDGAIHRAAGPKLREACEAVPSEPNFCLGAGGVEMLGERCPVGSVRPTPAFNLPCKWVFHTVGPVWPVRVPEDADPKIRIHNIGEIYEASKILSSCYTKALSLAFAMDLKSIAFPAISTGVYGCPHEECAYRASKAVLEFQSNRELDVTFYIYPSIHLGIWIQAMKNAGVYLE